MLKRKIKNILAIRSDRLGEFLLTIPALQFLKDTYKDAKLFLAVNEDIKEIAELVECVDSVLVWDKIKRNLRRFKFDICVVFNPIKEAHIRSFLASIPIRVGYNRKWGFLLTHKIEDTKCLSNRHEIICNLELVKLLNPDYEMPLERDYIFRLKVSYNEKYKFLEKAIAIHPFTSDKIKDWGFKKFLELGEKIVNELKIKVVFVGKTDKDLEDLNNKNFFINLVNKTTLVDLACVLKFCRLLITPDSGPMHLASVIGTPVIALFRNDLTGKTPKRWGPFGKENIVIEKDNLDNIKVDEVFEKVKEKIKADSK